MISKFKKPSTTQPHKFRSIQELDRERKEKEERFKEIVFSQADVPTQPPTQAQTPQTPLHPPPSDQQHQFFGQDVTSQYGTIRNESRIKNDDDKIIEPFNNNPYSLADREVPEEAPPQSYIERNSTHLQPYFMGEDIVNPGLQVRRNMAITISHAVTESICFNIVLLFISAAKIVGFISLLFGEEKSCKPAFIVWLNFMFVHDIIYLYYTYLILRTMRESDYHEDPQAQGGFIQVPRGSERLTGEPNHLTSQLLDDVDHWEVQRQINAYAIYERASSSSRLTNALNQITRYYYILLFIVGNYLLLNDTECISESPNHYNLCVTFVFLGYAYLGVPIIMVGSLCLCLPLVLIMYLILRRNEGQRPLRIDLMENLEKVKFSSAHKNNADKMSPNRFNKDCCICMVDYQDGDTITILPCNKIHKFHEECVRKWLMINGVCPICRQSVEGSVQQLQNMRQ